MRPTTWSIFLSRNIKNSLTRSFSSLGDEIYANFIVDKYVANLMDFHRQARHLSICFHSSVRLPFHNKASPHHSPAKQLSSTFMECPVFTRGMRVRLSSCEGIKPKAFLLLLLCCSWCNMHFKKNLHSELFYEWVVKRNGIEMRGAETSYTRIM